MMAPRFQKMNVAGLGNSVGTPVDGISAEVLVVDSFDELEAKQDQVHGKIVVFNAAWVSYGATVQYRSQGASRAAKYGAVAALIRSVTPFSIASVHTGVMSYSGGMVIDVAT